MPLSTTPLSFDAPTRETPRISAYTLYLQKLESLESVDYILPLIVCVYLHSNFSGGLRRRDFSAKVRIGWSRSSKVIDFGSNRKCACDFLLVRYSNLGPVLHRFRDIAGFLPPPIPLQSSLILGVFPLDEIADVEVTPSRSFKLYSREIIFEVFQPV